MTTLIEPPRTRQVSREAFRRRIVCKQEIVTICETAPQFYCQNMDSLMSVEEVLDASESELFERIERDLNSLSLSSIEEQLAAGGSIHREGPAIEQDNDKHNTSEECVGPQTPQKSCQRPRSLSQLQEDVCSICLDPINETERQPLVVRTNCRHEFHLHCLKRNRHFSNKCPMCRENLAAGLTPKPDRQPPESDNQDNESQSNENEAPDELAVVAEVMRDIAEDNFDSF